MKLSLVILMLFALANVAVAQKSVSALAPSHAAALHKYLAANKDVHFLQETAIEKDTFKSMREYFGKSFRPYYVVGDFNRDRRGDFALILSRDGSPKFATDEEAEARMDDRNLQLVVFNGSRKGFVVAHIENIEAPLACMIAMSDTKPRNLYFGVYESDADTFSLAPAGDGYIVEN